MIHIPLLLIRSVFGSSLVHVSNLGFDTYDAGIHREGRSPTLSGERGRLKRSRVTFVVRTSPISGRASHHHCGKDLRHRVSAPSIKVTIGVFRDGRGVQDQPCGKTTEDQWHDDGARPAASFPSPSSLWHKNDARREIEVIKADVRGERGGWTSCTVSAFRRMLVATDAHNRPCASPAKDPPQLLHLKPLPRLTSELASSVWTHEITVTPGVLIPGENQ
jgi:hypothetical protein